MKFLLFGTGDYYERYKKWFKSEDILALIDNSIKKQNTLIDGIKVLSPEDGIKLPFDAVVILSFYVRAMKEQLVRLKVPDKKIYHFYDLNSLLPPERMERKIHYYGNAEKIINNKNKEQKKILLLSQELTLGGPSIALFHAAEILKKHGHTVVYASMIDGPLREKLVISGIPVVVDENLQIAAMKDVEWLHGFSMLICNTINFHIFLTDRDRNIPIIWWLHDAPFFFDGIRQENLDRITKENLKVVSVGPVPQKAIQKFIPDLEVGELVYGVADHNGKKLLKAHSEKLCFVLIGFLENIKGQDILFKAVRLLPEEIRRTIEVLLVGHDVTLFAEQLKQQYKMLKEIRFTGSVDRKKIHGILDHADVLICPSRQDSMPTVVAEAMMHEVPCIVSDAIGTAEYIQDGIDGLIFHSEDAKALSDKMAWCSSHQEEIEKMGKKARKLYEKVFSMETFEENLLRIVD